MVNRSPARAVVLLFAVPMLVAAAERAPAPLFPPVAQLLGPTDAPVDVARLRVGEPGQRKAAVAALGIPGNVGAVPYLGAVLLQINEAVEVRVAAAMALGRVANWRCATFLRTGLKDASREVRFAAALALGKCKDGATVPALASALAADDDWWVRFAAAVALGDDRDPSSVKALAKAAHADPEWQVRMQAVRSLGQVGSREAAYALSQPLRDADPSVRAATAMALSEIGGLDSISLLASALHDETDDFPRRAMSDAIRKLLARP